MENEEQEETTFPEPNRVESIICIGLGRVMITPYNWSLVVLTVLIWGFSNLLTYSANANFDMTIAINEYAKYISFISIGVGLYFSGKRPHHLVGLGVANYLLSLITLIMSKVFFMNGFVGIFLLNPMSIFCLMLILKNIWTLGVDKAINESIG